MGKIIKVQKSQKKIKEGKALKVQNEIPYKKLKNEETSFKGKKNKKSHVLKLSKPTTGGIRKIILSKKEKSTAKSLKLKQNINRTLAAFEEDKNKKIREKRPIIGDLKPLLDSLPSLDELISIKDSSSKTGIASIDRRIPKQQKPKKKGKKEFQNEKKAMQLSVKTEKMLDRFDAVQKIWRNPEFQKNPRKLIAEQVKLRRIANEMET